MKNAADHLLSFAAVIAVVSSRIALSSVTIRALTMLRWSVLTVLIDFQSFTTSSMRSDHRSSAFARSLARTAASKLASISGILGWQYETASRAFSTVIVCLGCNLLHSHRQTPSSFCIVSHLHGLLTVVLFLPVRALVVQKPPVRAGGQGLGWVVGFLDRVRAFNSAAHARNGALLQPVHGLLDVRQRVGVFLALEWAGLEAAQAVGDDGQQDFLRNAIGSFLGDGAVLEQNGAAGCAGTVFVVLARVGAGVKARDFVAVVGAACAAFVGDHDDEFVVGGVRDVFCQIPHVLRPFRTGVTAGESPALGYFVGLANVGCAASVPSADWVCADSKNDNRVCR